MTRVFCCGFCCKIKPRFLGVTPRFGSAAAPWVKEIWGYSWEIMQSILQLVFRSLKLLFKNINKFSKDYDEICFRIIIDCIIVRKNYIKLICDIL